MHSINVFLIATSALLLVADVAAASQHDPTGQLDSNMQCDDQAAILFFEYPGDCRSYYVCFHNQLVVGQCPEGYNFDYSIQSCNYEDRVVCGPSNFKCPIPVGITKHEIANSCSQYITCKFGEPVPTFCPPGQHFSISLNGCTDIASAKCVADNSICYASSDGADIFVEDVNDCSKYYKCVNKELQQLQCANANEHWNPQRKLCVPQRESTCTAIGSTTPEAFPDPETLVICESESYHFLADDNDCSAYFICNKGVPYRQFCNQKLLFDHNTLKCQLPSAAQCAAEKYVILH